MIPFAWLLLLAVSHRVELVNEDFQIAPGDWQWEPIYLKQQPGMLSAAFQVQSGSDRVRLVLMRAEDIDDMPHGAMAQTALSRTGAFGHYLRDLGAYGVVVENQDPVNLARLHLNIWLDFSRRGPTVETLSPRRQLTVVLLSFLVFFGIVTWSARRLLKNVGPSFTSGNRT